MNKVISKDGTEIAFEKTGSGPAIILVDGAFCSRAMGPMPKLTPFLAQQMTVFLYDRRGRGDSGDTQPYNIRREIEDIEALIKYAGGSASLFGLSSGAVLALHAVAAGLNVSRLSLYEPPFQTSDTGHHPPKDALAQLNRLIAEGRRGDTAKYYLTKVIGAPALFAFILRLTPIWPKMKAVANSLPYDMAIIGDCRIPADLLASIKVPSIVIGGEKSPEMLRQAVQTVARQLPGARMEMLKRQTHNVSAKVLAPVLIDFLVNGAR
ncbi:MAG TPA: alpha/beta hydrolase [Puia sp.]